MIGRPERRRADGVRAIRARVGRLAGGALAVFAVWPAYAHNAGVSTSRIVVRGRTVELEINALGARLRKGGRTFASSRQHRGRSTPVALAVMAPAILSYVGDHVAVLAGDVRCSRGPASAQSAADTHVL